MIRPATAADAEAVALVHLETWRVAYRHALPHERLDDLSPERLAGVAELHRRAPPLVAEEDGAIVGFVSVGRANDDDADGELYAIYVRPDYWDHGLGRDLIAAGEERLRALGHTHAVLWVLEDNPRARQFYEGQGWTLDGSRRPITVLDVEVPEVRYEKQLVAAP